MNTKGILTKTQKHFLELFGTQFLLVDGLKDYPRLIEPLVETKWQNFFKEEARKLKKEIIES